MCSSVRRRKYGSCSIDRIRHRLYRNINWRIDGHVSLRGINPWPIPPKFDGICL